MLFHVVVAITTLIDSQHYIIKHVGFIMPRCIKGEHVMNTIDTNKKTVIVKHKTRCSDTPKALKGEDNPCQSLETTFDFSDCTEEEILNLATKSCIIAFRTKCKVNDITEEKFAELCAEPINVHEDLKAERKGMSASEKVTKLMGTMSNAERQLILEQLNNRK